MKGRQKIVIVDDNYINCFILKENLSNYYDNISVFAFPLTFIEHIDKSGCDYDIALLDIMMPDINGFELAKIISTKNKNTRLIGLTALPRNHNFLSKIEEKDCPIKEIIYKPFYIKELLDNLDIKN